jgi:hypothetical protein
MGKHHDYQSLGATSLDAGQIALMNTHYTCRITASIATMHQSYCYKKPVATRLSLIR